MGKKNAPESNEGYIPIEKAKNLDGVGQRVDALTGRAEDQEKRFKTMEDNSKLIEERLKHVNWLMVAIIVVLFIAVVGFILEYNRFQAESFTDLKKSVDGLRSDINNKNYEILLLKIDSLEQEIKELKEDKTGS